MKKKLTYRYKLLELAEIYKVKEIKEYIKRRKNLTSGQLELILKKNKITIPKDLNTSFVKENISKPILKIKSSISDFGYQTIKEKNRFLRKAESLKYDIIRNLNYSLNSIWQTAGKAGMNFLNILPKLGSTYYNFFGDLLTDLFNSIYNQKINTKNARNSFIGFFVIVGISTAILTIVGQMSDTDYKQKNVEVMEPKVKIKKEAKKPDVKVKKELKTSEVKIKKKNEKPQLKVKKNSVAEVILPDLNLKTQTVLNLFKDVDYNLKQVRNEKLVKPIYFTQFPSDLDALQSVKLKKETFIQIILPLVVAENEKILADKVKLQSLKAKKFTTDSEKQWLRQKLLEYKVKKGDMKELEIKIDIIPVSIALAQAAKESGWGTSRFALEGNAIFGQWTWNGKGIAPLNRDNNKKHKILKFPILRASVKAYQNNLNTHRSYLKFREKRKKLRDENKNIVGLDGLELTATLENYAQTGSEYTKILNQIITQNRLSDFEPVKLVNSVKRVELNS